MSEQTSTPTPTSPSSSGGWGRRILPLLIIAALVGYYVLRQQQSSSAPVGSDANDASSQADSEPGQPAEASVEFTLTSSSGAAMTAALEEAVRGQEWIVVTGWTPHWMFNRWDLKYLEDPKGVYGESEEIRTLARKGLREEMPMVVKFLDAFSWTPADMEQVMVWNTEEGADPQETAKRWVKENDETVEGWLAGIESRDLNRDIKLANVAWSSEIASANVVKAVLEEKLGCRCKITNTAAALMYESVATGGQDVMVGAWLPSTQKEYFEKIKDQVEDLGPNLVGTRIGLVVPAYVTIDSIEQLKTSADSFKSNIIGIDAGAGIMGKTREAMTTYSLSRE